jgi:hypothetical protein
MPAQYPRASDEFIRSSVDKTLFDKIYLPCYNLSCVISDLDGRISTGLLSQVLSGLEIVSPGVLVLGENVEDDTGDAILIEEEYAVTTSRRAFDVYTRLKVSDQDLVVAVNDADVGINSLLLSLSLDMPPIMKNAINALFIECLALYKELLGVTQEIPLTISLEDLQRISRNTRWITFRLESFDRVPYDLVEVIRDIQLVVFYVSSITEIFDTKNNSALKDLAELSSSLDSYNTPYSTVDYTISDGDTIHMIAQRMLGDASKAIDIILLNDLQYPFIRQFSDPPQLGVKTMGDVLKVPTFSTEEEPMDIDHIGADLKIVDRGINGGDLDGNTYGDLQIVEGVECLVQDLNSRFAVEVGTVPFHPNYGNGLKKLIGATKDVAWDQKVRVEVSKVLKMDIRVVEVVALEVFDIGQGIQVDAVLEVEGIPKAINYKYLIQKEG